MAVPWMEDLMATLGLITFAGVIAAQFLSVVYAAKYAAKSAPVEVRARR